MSSNCELDSGDHKAQSPRSLVSNSQATSSLANNIGRNMTTNEHSRDNTETSFTSTTIPTSTRTRKQHYHHHHKAPHELMHVTSSSRSTKQAASAACSPSQQQQARQQQHYQKILNSLQKPPMIMAQTVRDNTNAYEQFLQNLGCQNAASPMAPRPIRTTTMTTTTTRTTSTIAPSCTLRQGYCRCCRLRARRCHARHSECRLVSSRTRSPVAIGMGMGMGNFSLRALVIAMFHQIIIISLILHKFPLLEVAKTTPLFMVEASVANIRDGAGYHGLSLDNNIHHQSHNHNFHHSHKSNDQQQQQRQQRQQQLEPIIKSSIYNDITNNENDSEIGSARQRQQDNQQLLTRATTATSQSQKKKLDRRHRKRQYSEMQAKPTVTTMMMMMAAAAAATAPTNDDHDDDESNPSLPYRIGPLSFMKSGEIMKAGQAGQDKNKQIQAAIEEATISATSAYGAANQQTEPYQRRDQHGKLRASEAKRSAAASANRLEKRSKRHTIDHDDDYDSQLPSSNATVTTANQYGHQTTAAAGQLASLDCYKLATLWRYLQSSYPMLSGYLVELAVAKANGESGEQFQQQSAKSIQFARSIGQLLGDAERITAAAAASQQQQQPSSLLQVNYNKQSHNHNRHLPPGLARVYANPTYGKLVQYLRAQQQQQRPSTPSHQPAHRPTSSSSSSSSSGVVGPTTTWLQREDTGTNGNLNGPPGDDDREQMASLVQQQPSSSSSSSSSQEVYGRLIHYPHEIGRVDNSNGMARTLDKLRLLSHHSKQQQQQQQHQLSSGDIVEANRIQLAPDVDHISDTNWRKLDESAADLARNDIVYGTVLLRPSSPSSTNNNNRNDQEQGHPQHNSHNQQQQQQHNQRSPYHKPMSSLRELANERQRLMLMNGRPMTTQTESKTPIPSQMAIDGGTESDQTTADNDEEFEGEFHSGPLEQAELRLLSSSPDSHRSTTNGADKLMQPQVEPITKRTEFVLD